MDGQGTTVEHMSVDHGCVGVIVTEWLLGGMAHVILLAVAFSRMKVYTTPRLAQTAL